MLTIGAEGTGPLCDGASRRDFLRIGGLGLGACTLSQLLSAEALARPGGSYVRDKSIIFLFLCGGPSQIETFDPHMDSPAPAHSMTGEVKTSLPGVTFGGTFPKLAARADRMAVVRSYAPHQISDHAKAIRHVFTAGDPFGRGASIGALCQKLRGQPITPEGVPAFCESIENEIDPQYMEDMERMRSSNSSGQLGAAYSPFRSGGDGGLQDDMKLNVDLETLQDRRALLRSIDTLRRQADADPQLEAVDRYEQQAVELILGGRTREALDLSKEDPRTVARYDTGQFRAGYLKKRKSTLGRRLLMARRLVEAGARFVTVGMAGWDNHGNGKHPGVRDGMHLLGTPLDKALTALIDDLAERGLTDKVLLVVTGEFGRTPKIQAQGGRDHWPGLCSLMFHGGGLNMGQVIGASEKTADTPATDPWRLENMFASIMHTLFDIGQLRLDTGAPRDLVELLNKTEPIRELFG